MNFGKQLKEGVITNNPVLVQILGMCPTLAVSTSLFNGIGMGICATLVLMCSNLVISLLRNIIPNKVRIAAFIVVIAGFVTCVDLLLKAFVPALSDSLGVFIPLIVVNCIILGRAEAFAYKNPPLASVVDGLTQGIGFTCALTILSVAREFLGSGHLWRRSDRCEQRFPHCARRRGRYPHFARRHRRVPDHAARGRLPVPGYLYCHCDFPPEKV